MDPQFANNKQENTNKGVRPKGRMSQLAMQAREIMDKHGYNPIEALIEIATDEENTPLDLRIQSHKELCKYYAPQLKSMDVNHAIKGSISFKLMSYAESKAELQGTTPAGYLPVTQDESIIDAEYTKTPGEDGGNSD